LEGIKQNYALPPQTSEGDGDYDVLPANLNEAISVAQSSELARRVLGDALLEKFLANKRIEWENYRMQVHQYELDRYMGIL
jgi:glutamine synthetase